MSTHNMFPWITVKNVNTLQQKKTALSKVFRCVCLMVLSVDCDMRELLKEIVFTIRTFKTGSIIKVSVTR